MSRALDEELETSNIIPDAYVLEISSPGISESLTSDREFVSFKGFSIIVKTSEPYKGHSRQRGKLVSRDENAVYLSQKGRQLAIPRELITEVLFDESVEE
jgi:ribosome maturation factor RimP